MKKTSNGLFSGLNENELNVLFAVRKAIEDTTGNEFCYFEDIIPPLNNDDEKMPENVLKGYISSLQSKNRISVSDEFRQINMMNANGEVIPEFIDIDEELADKYPGDVWQW